ncbi:BnaAnng14890D [Brassica napus]|uniref:BnaAnng14890D protein n=1 Tax=Brassica napus TaxID=3708 RepID=A0A078J4I0_BRANA|nr:BnaAnng14890D [Brassica napus]
MMGGDFNQILHSTEQSVPFDYNNSSAMYQFRDTLLQVGLFDSRFQGPSFSWSNKQHALPIAKKLDRMLLNYASIQSFPHATSFFQAPMISDHSPCLTDLAFPLSKAGTQPFKFLNYLTKHPNFHQVVQDAWIQAGSLCMDLASLCWKLKNIKRELRTLNKEIFSNIQERVKEAYRLLQILQVQSLDSPSAETFLQESILSQKWHFLRQIEESYFKQKSRINWLSLGDQNTTFFQRMCQARASYNAIRSFLLASGEFIVDPLEMSHLAVGHFKSVLGPEGSVLRRQFTPLAWFHSLTPFRCSVAQQNQMILLPTSEEITRIMFKLNPNKAPGPDGLSSGFFKAAWGIPQRATLASLSDNGNWTLPPARTENQIELQAYLTTLVLTEEEDCYEWEIAGRTSNAFSTGEVYTYLRGSIATVNWSHLVWSSFGIPRQSFLTWLVMLDRCPTKDRMISWGLDVSPTCLLCNSQPESRNHLFFDCPFACVIWSAIASRRRLHALQNWEATVLQLMQLTGTKHSKRLTLLCWQSTIYFIWRERNDRLHRGNFRSPELIIRGLDRLIRNMIQSIRVENPRSSSAMMQDWLGSN